MKFNVKATIEIAAGDSIDPPGRFDSEKISIFWESSLKYAEQILSEFGMNPDIEDGR